MSYQTAKFEIDLDSIGIKNVAILPSREAGDLFGKKIFPLFPDVYFLTVEPAYPENNELRELLIKKLASDPELAVILFTIDAPQKIEIKSQRILCLDQLIAYSNPGWKAYEAYRSEIDEMQLVKMMSRYYDQWRQLYRGGNFEHRVRHYIGFDQDSMGWLLDLISSKTPKKA